MKNLVNDNKIYSSNYICFIPNKYICTKDYIKKPSKRFELSGRLESLIILKRTPQLAA